MDQVGPGPPAGGRPGFRCPVCGQALGRPGACPNRWCRRPDRQFSVVYAISSHEGRMRRAIARYKYRGQVALADVFAAVVAGFLTEHATWFEEFDLLACVPSYTGPGSRRGWDPVATVAEAARLRLGDSWLIRPATVVKRRETPAMQGLGWSQRQDVARGALRRSLLVPRPELVRRRRVLVLDDVMTDGSTLREVALALRRAGAEDVAGLVLARPGWDFAGPPEPARAGSVCC